MIHKNFIYILIFLLLIVSVSSATLPVLRITLKSTGGGGTGGIDFFYINYLGSNLSGVSGATNRTLNTTLEFIVVDNFILHPDYDYNYNGTQIEFYNSIWDDQDITSWTTNASLISMNYEGSDLSGNDGDINRNLELNGSGFSFIVVDNFQLQPNDYALGLYNLTFKNSISNSSIITIWNSSSVTSYKLNTNNFDGVSGDLDRNALAVNLDIVTIDNFNLHPEINYDYNPITTNLKLLDFLWSDQIIIVWS